MYCERCGERLSRVERYRRASVPSDLAEKMVAGARALVGERKQVTVLFADVKGSMELSERLDAEEWHGIMDRCVSLLCDGVHRYEGTVSQFTGDGLMALFGAPIAREDHARRGCLAALDLRDTLAGYAVELGRDQGLEFAVRLGLNSGEVVLGSIGADLHLDFTAVGHSVGLAQRMEQLARPGSVCVSENTAALVEGFFDVRDLGLVGVKGVHERVRVFELVGRGEARTALQAARRRGLSRFVGRDRELAVLDEALERTLAGDGQVVGIVGEPGVGKSRLCDEFVGSRGGARCAVYRANGVSHGRSVPFLPVLEILRDFYCVDESDAQDAVRERIERRLLGLDRSFGADLPLVFDFLGVADPERPLPQVDPEARQRQLLGFITRQVQASSRHEPSIVVLEDLHWFDEASAVFLEELVRAVVGTRTLVVATFRPEYQAAWMVSSAYQRLALHPLDAQAIGALLDDLIGAAASLDGLGELIDARADGNPFFMEELVRALVETGYLDGTRGAYRLARPVEGEVLPATVQALLAARIDRLGAGEKLVLQSAAVIGRRFSERMLVRVTGLAAPDLSARLGALIAAELVLEHARGPEREYAFRHALTEQVAYRSQLTRRRAQVHARVAATLEELYPDSLDERAALIAHHCEQAGETLNAARWSARAATWAGFTDPFEALRHWRKVMSLSDSVAASDEQANLALSSRLMILRFAFVLGVPDDQTPDAFDAETTRIYTQGDELARARDDSFVRAMLRAAYGAVRGTSGHAYEAYERSLEAVELTRSLGDPGLEVAVRTGATWSCVVIGHYRELQDLAAQGITVAGDDPSTGAGLFFVCPYAFLLMMQGAGELYTGRPAGAIAQLERAAAVAAEQGDVETQGWAHVWLTMAASFCGVDHGVVLSYARQAMEAADQTGSAWSRGWAHEVLGLAYLCKEDWTAADAALEDCIEIWRQRRIGRAVEALALACRSRAQLGSGQVQAAVATAREAVAAASQRQIEGWEPEARLALARALMASDGADASSAVERELERTRALLAKTGARTLEPHVQLALAELALTKGDESGYEHGLSEARRLFVEIGAPALAERAQRS